MLRDVFYFGKKPNVHPRERFAESLADARQQATTEHFWIINEFCDYRGFDWDFDFEFLPNEDVWAEDHNNAWPSQHQKDSGTWLCPKEHSDIIIYRSDVNPVIRRNEKHDNWVLLEPIDESKFDFSWHPDPSSPPYIYVWGNKWVDAKVSPTLEYHVPGATDKKYMFSIVEVLPNPSKFEHFEDCDGIDYSWRPDPTSPPYIYVWGNQWNKPEDKISIQYVVEGATEYKYMEERATRRPCHDNWITPDDIDDIRFDYSWEPNPKAPPYVYEFGTQWQKTGGPCYVVEGATERKYIDDLRATKKPNMANWTIPDNIDASNFDFSWHPDATSPPYIYRFPTQWALSGGPVYTDPNATEVKYVDDQVAVALPCKDNWEYNSKLIDENEFDFSWHPYVEDEPYVYQFGTQWQKTGGPKYVTPGVHKNSPTKYIDTRILKAKRLPNPNAFTILDATVKDFDYSWHPDETEEPFIYQFGNNLYPAEIMPTLEYKVSGAKKIKYVQEVIATLGENKEHWEIPDNIDDSEFDYSWVPNPKDPPYIYEFATQWQKTGGPRYIVEGATEVNYVDHQKVKHLPNKDNWTTINNIDEEAFDYSWHPDATSPPYIYRFPTQWALSGGPVYTIESATEVKYVDDQKAIAIPSKEHWVYDPNVVDEDDFDYSWHPYVEDEPYIYQFGTQWQKTGGHKYMTPGVHKNSPTKYIDTRILKSKRLPNEDNWKVLNDYVIADFDYSWHPDETEEPYIYQFGNNQYPAEEMPTVEYRVKGAKQVKYVNDIIARLGVDMTHWEVPNDIDVTNFDFSWRPHPGDPPLIHQFGTQWQKTGGPKYIVEGATETTYVRIQNAIKLPSKECWEVPDNIDGNKFDFSWHPDATSPPYIYKFATQWALSGGPAYKMPGATEVKYVEEPKATAKPNKEHWVYDTKLIDEDSFDFSWHPYADDEPFIYQFGTQWQKTGGPRYVVPGATQIKYIDTRILKATRLPNNNENWHVLKDYEILEFDYSWHPDGTSDPYIYIFGNTQYPAEEMPTIEYRMPGATQKKYVNDNPAKLAPTKENWEIVESIKETSFDFSWRPHPKSPAYIYIFGNTQYPAEEMPTIKYIVPGAKQTKYVHDNVAELAEDRTNWEMPVDVDANSFDFSWKPHPKSPPYIYQFGTQWQKTGGPRYVVKGAKDLKYIEKPTSRKLPSKENWKIPKDIDVSKFDFSWHPDATADPAIYQFGSVPGQADGPRYVVPGNQGNILYLQNVELDISIPKEIPRYFIETTLEDLIEQHNNEVFWALNKDLDYSKFDFEWRPDVYQSNYIHAFGSKENIDTQTYFVNAVIWEKGFKNINYVETDDITVKADLDMFFVDRGNKESQERFDKLKQQFPKLQKTRYLNSWADTIIRGTNRATSNLLWVLNSELDYADFDFDYYPNPWQMKMVHVFGTQWSHWGTTFLVNREQFPIDTKYIKIVEHLSNLNFVKTIRAKATQCVYDIVLIDHKNPECENVLELLKSKAGDRTVTTIEYENSYLETLRKVIKKQTQKKEHYIWLCSSICDYSDFDFSYICDPFAKDQLHVFPSGTQKFGDTFFIDVNKARELLEDMSVLEEFHKVNFNATMRVQRLSPPEIVTTDDTLVETAKKIEDWPYAVLMTDDNKDIEAIETDPISLWSPETKNIVVTSTGSTRIIVPREAKNHIKKELYDYPYIKKSSRLAMSKPVDIVFLSNGEAGAEENWEHLQKITKGIKNRVVRVDGVNGRVAAYHAAVEASETPWAFTVFAKLKVSNKFDWNWQPDRMQVPKHYIFQAKNPVNGLIYGHQAMIAYNKKLTLTNDGKGLDFTLDDEHEVVEMLSGIAVYNTDEFSTWRTAFREVIKLRAEDSPDSNERLDAWLNKAEGDFAEFSIKGALDADEYYDDVDGDFEKLKLSYEWEWLKKRFDQS